MPRARMVRPEFWDDATLSTITRDARLVFIALWNFSDDYGVVKAHPVWLKNHVFPYEESLSLQKFSGWLKELEEIRAVLPFKTLNNEKFYLIRTFSKHQTINRPSEQRNPEPPDGLIEDSMSDPLPLIPEVKLSRSKVEREEKGKLIYSAVVSHLNKMSGKNFKPDSKETRSLIDTKLKAGFTENDFYIVIDNKAAKWRNDSKMCEYLRPQTLFGTKFESYLNDTAHPLQGTVSDVTIKNIETLNNWEPGK